MHDNLVKQLFSLRFRSLRDNIHKLSIRKCNIVIISFITAFAILFTTYLIFTQTVSAISPTFIRQEIKDPTSDWILLSTGNKTSGSKNTDIQSVTYYSNGNILNATLWLSSFKKEPHNTSSVSYGVYIDADFNSNSGSQGIDYIGKVEWNRTTNNWNYSFNELASNGKERLLGIKDDHVTPFNERGSYITLSVDLRDALLPPHIESSSLHIRSRMDPQY